MHIGRTLATTVLAAVLAACSEPSPTSYQLEPVPPAFSLTGGGSASIAGTASITQAGSYNYGVCLSGRPTGNYFAQLYTSSGGNIDTFNLANGLCTSGSTSSVYADHTTADFSVWAKIYKYPLGNPTYIGDSNTLAVDVDVSPPPPSVYVAGDASVSPSESCSWQAIASGGTPPYSYSWWGALSGSSSSVSGTISQSSYLYVQVTDANSQTDTNQIFIDVDEAYQCEE